MFTTLKYNKSKIDHAIFIKVISDVTVSYLTVSNDDVINTTNNETEFTELTRVYEEYFEIKVQEGSVFKYLNFPNLPVSSWFQCLSKLSHHKNSK